MTIVETLTWANNRLKEHNIIDGAMLDAQLLLGLVLNVSKNYLFSHFEQNLTDEQLTRFESLIVRRCHHEPLAYILGKKEFFGKQYLVNPFVLIPRPETEQLVEIAIKAGGQSNDVAYLDIGTGSGAIAITLAQQTGAPVIATDISARALSVAKQNAELLGAEKNITFFEGNLIDVIPEELTRPLDMLIITANLPYLPTKIWSECAPEVKDYEPKLALDGGVDGLDLYNDLFRSLKDKRSQFPEKLLVILEIDPGQKIAIQHLIAGIFLKAQTEIFNDLTNRPRLVLTEI